MDSSSNRIILYNFLDCSFDGEYRILFGDEITASDIRAALNIDYLCYDDIYHLDWERCVAYHKKNPLIYIMAVDSSRNVVGYTNFSPVTESIYESMRSGKSVDTAITADDILEFEQGKEYSIYFSSICVHPDHRGLGIAKMLLFSLQKQLDELSSSGVVIRRIVADAVTESGAKLLIAMGFKNVCISEHDSQIMERYQNG